jgi:hypothetical protein
MSSVSPDVSLIGFEKDSELGALFTQVGLFQNYKSTLPGHLADILRKQHPDIVIESVELLDTPKCNLGGMQQPGTATLVRVQTLDASLHLRLRVRVAQARHSLDVQLVIKCEGLDSAQIITSDLFIRGQERLPD